MLSTNQTITTAEEKKEGYQPVSLEQAKSHRGYWYVLENMFREQAIRMTQRNARKKLEKKFTGKYAETLTSPKPLSLRFIKETLDSKKAIEYSNLINSGKYTELHFQDPEFVRDIYQGLRLKLISPNQLADALFIRGMQEQFKGQVKKFHLEEKGPFDISKISYITEQNLKTFSEQTKLLPENERCYFSINLPKPQLLAFLYQGIAFFLEESFDTQFFTLYPFYCVVFEKYIQQLKVSDHEKNTLLNHVNNLKQICHYGIAKLHLLYFLVTHEKEYSVEMTSTSELIAKKNESKSEYGTDKLNIRITGKVAIIKESTNIKFLISLLRVAEEFPALEISPDYNPNDPSSPILCFNLPTMSVFNTLLFSLFGEKDAVYPFFTAGQVSTRLIRYLDEKPSNYELKNPARPVEIIHPDLVRSQTFHTYDAFDFMGSFHDLFHAFKCSANTLKPCLRYLTNLESNETKHDMSKAIFSLADRDFQIANKLRLQIKQNNQTAIRERYIEDLLLLLVSIDFGSFNLPNTDIHLLYVIDMIINYKTWEELAKIHPIEAAKNRGDFTGFITIYEKMKQLIDADFEDSKTYKSIKYYILAFRLKYLDPEFYAELDKSNMTKVMNDLYHLGLEKTVYWKKNKENNLELYFQKGSAKSSKDVTLKHHTSKLLYENLVAKQTEIASETKQSGFFKVGDKKATENASSEHLLQARI